MELISLGVGLLVNTCAKNKAVNTAIDDFVTESVQWVRGWFKKSDKVGLVQSLEIEPQSEEVQAEVKLAFSEMIQDEQFRKELELWIQENKKPNPSMKNVITRKNVIEDANIEVGGNIKIGDKSVGLNTHDEKNILKNTTIKGGGDFNFGDG